MTTVTCRIDVRKHAVIHKCFCDFRCSSYIGRSDHIPQPVFLNDICLRPVSLQHVPTHSQHFFLAPLPMKHLNISLCSQADSKSKRSHQKFRHFFVDCTCYFGERDVIPRPIDCKIDLIRWLQHLKLVRLVVYCSDCIIILW